MEEITYPMRINRYLALTDHCSRREADALIEKGLVKINQRLAKIGDKINKGDVVQLNTKAISAFKECVYFAYHKPRGIVTHSPEEGQKSIHDATGLPKGIFPIGRLDKESRGLIILTNDGRVTDKLLNPEREHEKEYAVSVNKPLTNIFLKVMAQGVQLEDYKTKPCKITKKTETSFHIILTEGKKHQIRRMCAALGWSVVDLKRVRIGNIKLGGLRAGQQKKITGKELSDFLRDIGIN